MDMELNGASVVITGGASGIGRASACAFAAEGSRIAVLDRDEEGISSIVRELVGRGIAAVGAKADVTDEESVRSALISVARELSGIDVLVCCAGVSGLYGRTIEEVSVDEWEGLMAVNVRGQWLPTKHSLPYLRRSDRAAVVIVASDSGLVASPHHVPYCTSKGAVVMLTRALSVDLAVDNIRVNCVSPSVVDTPMSRSDLKIATDGFDGGGYPVQDAAQIARYLVFLGSRASASMSGHALVADFGYSARSAFPA